MAQGERIHSLAKKLGIKSAELIEKLNSEGIKVTSHMNVLDPEKVELVLKMYSSKKAGKKEPAKRATKAKEKKAPKSAKDKSTASVKKEAAAKVSKKGKKEKEEKKPSKKAELTVVEPAIEKKKEKIEKKGSESTSVEKAVKTEEAIKETPTPSKEAEKPQLTLVEDKSAVEKEEEAPKEKVIEINEGATVKEVAEKMNVPVKELMGKLIGLGVMANINQSLDSDTIELIGMSYDTEIKIAKLEEEEALEEEEEEENLEPRPPVVTIMGHVDHGKTSLLDAIRETNVIAGEAGGITQHIGAYHVKHEKGTIVFLDTPGHHAFTAMRARGAQVTDIVVLIVAADDGVMPQTKEAIDHARAAGVPIIVAVNKIDKPNADPQKVRTALSELGLVPEEWGGDTIFVDISAKKRININDLLELILLQAELLELKANPKRRAVGTIIESKLDKKRGPVATVLIQKGTLRIGDPFIAGTNSGKVRALFDDKGKRLLSAGPSMPVMVLGFSGVPEAGDTFTVTEDEKAAKQMAIMRLQKKKEASFSAAKKITLEELSEQIKSGIAKELRIILKTDVHGSAQAIEDSLNKLSTSDVKVKIIHSATGGVNESDVILASASNAIIIGFNVRPSAKAVALAEQEKVDMHFYTVIYDLIDEMKSTMEGLLEPRIKEQQIGRAQVREVFHISKVGKVAGSYVLDGKIERNSNVRLVRDNVIIYEGKLASLKRFKDDVKEVPAGYECGIRIENFNDIKVDDIIEAFVREEVKRKL
ncbi:MAG: translation initiation factor IF-2 [Candidatus Schekmanbacteria bacterium]|nr:MAG: translation initiation factor IF-2 [Candidatus Schekmanbacteria bacterium]